MHGYAKVETDLVNLWVGWSPEGIAMISLADKKREAFDAEYERRFSAKPQRASLPEAYAHAVREAAAGRVFAQVPVDLSGLTAFQLSVLKVLQQVPRGEVRTYTWLAQAVGRPKAARAVGNTMAWNPVPILIPCHRVVPSSGGVGNYGLGGPAVKKALLQREGVPATLL
jgi:methylated-DNA-[protein]-cysteine S-methyltransferase